MTSVHPLDDPVGASLRGAHSSLARGCGSALAYLDGVATFVAVPPAPAGRDWDDLATLLGPGGFADLFSSSATPPAEWEPVFRMEGVQMVADGEAAAQVLASRGAAGQVGNPRTADVVVELGPTDASSMGGLVAATRPGPFWHRTTEMGTYVGFRRGGRLVAKAGERLHPPGWVEISAVATDPSVRGQGLAGHVVRYLMAHITASGRRPFLHVAADNLPAVRLYERLGFEVRRYVMFRGFTVPSDCGALRQSS